MISNEAWLTVGKLVAPQGLHGEIRIKPYSDFPERFTQPGKRWIQEKAQSEPLEIELISGKKLNSFCLLFRKPSPSKPPEPILISDCNIFHFSDKF